MHDTNPLILPPDLAHQIEREGVSAYPSECCGVMYGRDMREDGIARRAVERIEALANAFDPVEQYHRFSIDPKELMRAEATAAKEGRLVLGFYHSHPDHPARPSEYDRAHAWPFYSYVIVAIAKREPGDMTSWVLDEESEQFLEQRIASV